MLHIVQSDCQFRESVCLLQSECQEFKKKQDGRNSRWQKVCQLRESAYLLQSVCLYMFASVCVSVQS